MITVTYHRLVQSDIQGICDYFDTKGDGLGDAFFAEFESVIEGIRRNPEKWPPIKEGRDKRKARFRRFPYVIVYRRIGESRVRIFVVKHKKRRETLGMRRR